MKNGNAGIALHGAFFFGNTRALGYTRKGTKGILARSSSKSWRFGILISFLVVRTLQGKYVSHPNSVLIFLLSPMMDDLTERYPKVFIDTEVGSIKKITHIYLSLL
jgi:hypothetical protein